MKVCPKCSAENQDTAEVCEKCGEVLDGTVETVESDALSENDFLNKASGILSAGAKKAKEAAAGIQKAASEGAAKAPKGTEPRKNIAFVDQGETAVATIGSNYLQNYLIGGTASKGIGILTQKRFYYMGKSFAGSGKEMESSTKEGVVDIEDISSTELSHVRHIGFLLVATLLTIAAIPLPTAVLIAAIPFYVMYFVKRSSIFIIAFPGGAFAFNIHWYPIEDIRDFQRQLHLLKDKIKEEQRA